MRVDVGRLRETRGVSLSARGIVSITEPMGTGVESLAPVDVELTVTYTGRFIHLEGTAAARISVECVRCLSPVSLSMSVPVVLDYLPAGASDIQDESIGEFTLFKGGFIIVDPAVTEAILLALPMKPLCRDDCPGLCPACGRNLSEGQCACGGVETMSHPAKEV